MFSKKKEDNQVTKVEVSHYKDGNLFFVEVIPLKPGQTFKRDRGFWKDPAIYEGDVLVEEIQFQIGCELRFRYIRESLSPSTN